MKDKEDTIVNIYEESLKLHEEKSKRSA